LFHNALAASAGCHKTWQIGNAGQKMQCALLSILEKRGYSAKFLWLNLKQFVDQLSAWQQCEPSRQPEDRSFPRSA
jgi:hypothetical protein